MPFVHGGEKVGLREPGGVRDGVVIADDDRVKRRRVAEDGALLPAAGRRRGRAELLRPAAGGRGGRDLLLADDDRLRGGDEGRLRGLL